MQIKQGTYIVELVDNNNRLNGQKAIETVENNHQYKYICELVNCTEYDAL